MAPVNFLLAQGSIRQGRCEGWPAQRLGWPTASPQGPTFFSEDPTFLQGSGFPARIRLPCKGPGFFTRTLLLYKDLKYIYIASVHRISTADISSIRLRRGICYGVERAVDIIIQGLVSTSLHQFNACKYTQSFPPSGQAIFWFRPNQIHEPYFYNRRSTKSQMERGTGVECMNGAGEVEMVGYTPRGRRGR